MTEKLHSIAETREQVAKLLKSRVEQFSAEMLQLRQRELSKSQGSDPCLICGSGFGACVCMTTLAKSAPVEKCGESMPTVGAPKVKKGELCADCGSKDCKCAGVLPGDKKSKDTTPKKNGSGGAMLPGKKLKKGDVPMAKPAGGTPSMSAPTAKVGAPKIAAKQPKAVSPPLAKAEGNITAESFANTERPEFAGNHLAGLKRRGILPEHIATIEGDDNSGGDYADVHEVWGKLKDGRKWHSSVNPGTDAGVGTHKGSSFAKIVEPGSYTDQVRWPHDQPASDEGEPEPEPEFQPIASKKSEKEQFLIEQFLAKASPPHPLGMPPAKGSAMPDTWNPTEHETPAAAAPKPRFGAQDLAAAKAKLSTPAVPAQDFTPAAAGMPAPAGGAAAAGVKPAAAPAALGAQAASPAKNRMAALSAALRGQKPS